MKRKRILVIAASLILLIVLGKFLFFSSSGGDVPTTAAAKGDFNILVIESGSIRAKNSFTVTAPRPRTGGSLQVVYLAPEGTIATPDQVLIRFDPSTALKSIEDNQVELKTAMADLAKLKAEQSADESQATTDFENAKLSFQLAEIAKQRMEFEPESQKREANLEFEKAKLAFDQAKLNLENKSVIRKSEMSNTQLRISQIQSNIAAAMKEMELLTIKAPMGGLIVYETNWSTGRKIAVGDQPWPGMPIISLPDLSAAQVEVSINEMDIAKVKQGQRVEVVPDAFPDRKFYGTISSASQIGREKASGSNVKVFDIVVDLDKTDEILKPGITTTNRVIVGTVPKVVSVPIVCVVEEGKATFLYVKDGSSFEKREVVLGDRNDNFVVVKRGVAGGEQVALRNPEEQESAAGNAAGNGTGNGAARPASQGAKK